MRVPTAVFAPFLLAAATITTPAAVWAAPPVATAPPVAIEGTVVGRSSAWQGGFITTRTMVRVERAMRGAPPAVIEVTGLGGRVGDIAQIVHGQPTMPAGPRVAIELSPVGQTWRLGGVLEPAGAGDAEVVAIGATNYVRATNQDSEPPCGGATRQVFWPTTEVRWVLDAACSPDVEVDACEAAVKASFQTWENVACAYLAFPYDGRVQNASIGYDQQGINLNVVKWFETDWPGSADAQAITLTTVGCTTGRQYDADILVNGTNPAFTFTTAPMIGSGLVDVQNTITHEVGHLAGFAHSSDPESTMFFTASVDETKKRDLTADDELGLCATYAVGREPGGGGGCGCRAAGAWAGGERLTSMLTVVGMFLIAALTTRRRRQPRADFRNR